VYKGVLTSFPQGCFFVITGLVKGDEVILHLINIFYSKSYWRVRGVVHFWVARATPSGGCKFSFVVSLCYPLCPLFLWLVCVI